MLRRLVMLALAAAGLSACNPQPYQQKNGVWHFEDSVVPLEPGEELTPLNIRFAKTQRRAFHRNTPIAGADGATFVALDNNYAKDARRAYWANTYRKGQEYYAIPRSRVIVIEGARVAAFKALEHGYAMDGARVYFEGGPFPVRDAASFQLLDYAFQRDRVRGYYFRTEVPDSDGATFAVAGNDYARDKDAIYFATTTAEEGGYLDEPFFARAIDATASSLQVLEAGYARTDRAVYYRGRVVEGADPASFEASAGAAGEPDAKDKSRRYLRGKPVS